MSVYKAINKVQAAMASQGISKGRKNQQQGYQFRGIDDVYNALSPFLAEHGLCILPRMLTRQCEERTSAKGGALFYVTVEAEFDFVCAEDGSTHIVKTFGEAMDSADKATNKAMSAAYKYACMQAFAIPTEGDNDADGSHHNVAPSQRTAPAPASPPVKALPANYVDSVLTAIKHLISPVELEATWSDAKKACQDAQDRAAYDQIRAAVQVRLTEIQGAPTENQTQETANV